MLQSSLSRIGNCEEELPKKPIGRLSVNCRSTVDRQVTDSVGCCIKRKPRENIKVCVSVLPTSYRQVTDRLPTVGRLSADCRPTVSRQVAYISGKTCRPSVSQLSADKRPTVGQLSADCRLTVDRQSADRFFGELFFTITPD